MVYMSENCCPGFNPRLPALFPILWGQCLGKF